MPSDLYTQFVSRCLFPLHEKLKRHTTTAIVRDLEQSQWRAADEIADRQSKRLQAFMQTIYAHVPYYAEIFQNLDISPSEIQTPGDLQRLPLLEKSDIRGNTEALKSRNAENLAKFNTGGSSGEPLIFYIGKKRVSHDVAAKWRATRWWDVDIGDKELVIWGSPIELGAQDRMRMIRDRVIRTRLLSAFDLGREQLAEFIAQIRAVRPRMLFGYPSVISLIAGYAEQEQIPLNNLGIRVVFVTSERLYEHQREKIESVFGCRVANGYGGRDAGFIAHECPSGSLHITAEDIVVEIVDSNGNQLPPGESGEIVVTHLATEDFPFVRYRTGDIGSLARDACACGRGLPVLESVDGRSTDFIVASDGSAMHGLALIYILRDIPTVSEFKIVQESIDRTRVIVAVSSGFDQETEQFIESEFKRRLGNDVRVDIEKVKRVSPEKSGKFRYVISKVESLG